MRLRKVVRDKYVPNLALPVERPAVREDQHDEFD
jgi:hypothetical protein